MRRRWLLLFAVCVAAALLVLVFSLSNNTSPNSYQYNINRNVSGPQEEAALSAAEAFNYSALTSEERFDGPSDPQAYLNPKNYLAYTYANFIDQQTLTYYQVRYENQQGKAEPKAVAFLYEANADPFSQIRIFNSGGKNSTVALFDPNSSSVIKTAGLSAQYSNIYLRNETGYAQVQPGFDFTFTDCMVEMKLHYSETYAPLAAFGSEVYQLVILDRDLSPVFIGIQSSGYVS
jgi:hypothetical protein